MKYLNSGIPKEGFWKKNFIHFFFKKFCVERFDSFNFFTERMSYDQQNRSKYNVEKIKSFVSTTVIAICFTALIFFDLSLIIFGSHWYLNTENKFIRHLIETKNLHYNTISLCVAIFMGGGLLSLGFAIYTKYSLIFMIISFLLQICSNICSVIIGFFTTNEAFNKFYVNALSDFTSTPESSVIINQYGCNGVKISGCESNCCDDHIHQLLEIVFSKPFWFYILPLCWCVSVIILLPTLYYVWHNFNKKN